ASSELSCLPVSRNSALTNSPPLIPIRRWIRQTESSIPALPSTSCQASTCWYTLSTSVPSRSKRSAGARSAIALVWHDGLDNEPIGHLTYTATVSVYGNS